MAERGVLLSLVGALLFAGGLLAPSAASAGDGMFGLVSSSAPNKPPTRSEFHVMSGAGVKTFRTFFPWPLIEPEDDEIRWRLPDAAIARAANEGIRAMPFLWGSPPWVERCEDDHESCVRRPPLASRSARASWREIVRALVQRYGPQGEFWRLHPNIPERPVRAWQIWNEPNLTGFYGPKPSPRGYARLLKLAAGVIRREDPTATVLLGGLGPGAANRNVPAATFLDRLYRIPRAKRWFDAVAVHPYSETISGLEANMELTREVMRRHRDARTRLWVTEIGWSSRPRPAKLAKGRKGQAALISSTLELFTEQRRPWRLRRAFLFSWRDRRESERQTCWCAQAGLREADLDAKPAWTAFESFLAAPE